MSRASLTFTSGAAAREPAPHGRELQKAYGRYPSKTAINPGGAANVDALPQRHVAVRAKGEDLSRGEGTSVGGQAPGVAGGRTSTAVVSQAQPPRRGTDAPSRWTRRHGVKCHSRIPGGRVSTAAAAA